MANNLTGDFDVVAEFALPAVNRILAAMHQCERFLHSVSLRVDDNPPPGPKVPTPVVVGVVDAFGDAIADQGQVSPASPQAGSAVSSSPDFGRLGVLVNPDLLSSAQPPVTPSHIQGVAQLQLFPPTVSVPSGLPNYLTVTTNVMARYFPDEGTAPLAQFMRGDISITAPVDKIATGRVHVLDIDFTAEDASISFNPSYSSESLSPEDLAGISLCIANGLRTSFLPSSVMLPSSIADVQLKTLPGALALLLDLNDHTPASTPASVGNVFLNADDDFAFAIGRDFILNLFNSQIGNFTQFQPFTVSAFYGSTTYTITLTSAPTLDLQNNIVLTIRANAHSSNSLFPSFNFTTNISFTLNLVATGGGGFDAAELALVNVSLDFTDSGLEGWFKDLVLGAFQGRIISQITAQVNSALNPPNPEPTDLQPTIRQMTNADANIGSYLTAQLSPADGSPPPSTQQVFLMYTSVDIQPAGVVLHGSVLLFDWPAPNIEFEQIPTATSGSVVIANAWTQGKDYSALKSWIPGGTIHQYEWSYQGQANPFRIDPNTFVLLASGPAATEAMIGGAAVPAYTSLCLTVRGTRLTNFGPVIPQPVSATLCAYRTVPVFVASAVSAAARTTPLLTLTRAGVDGLVATTGHVAAQNAQAGANAPNLIIHFADAKTATQLEVLTEALSQSKRIDAAAVPIAVLTPAQLSKTRYTPGIIYSDDSETSWEVLLGRKSIRRPLTVIVGPRGSIAWRAEGALDRNALSAALAKYLVATGTVQISMARLNIRIGQLAPSFLFEFSSGRVMPLTKFRGTPVCLVFWKRFSRPSLNAVRDCQNQAGQNVMVLAINDGDPADVVRSVAAENRWTVIVVADPKREISSAYGVELWPTVVSIDTSGAIAAIRYGYGTSEHDKFSQPASVAR